MRVLSAPRDFWRVDEVRLAQNLLTFDGESAPLLVALARLFNVFIRDPLLSLVALSVLASVAGAIFIGLAASRLLESEWGGAAVAIVAFFAPASLVFGSLPGEESVAMAFVAAALFFFVRRRAELFAGAAAASIGVEPDLAPAMIVLFAIGIATMEGRTRGLVVFATVLLPFAAWIGVPRLDFAPRLVAHPWGAKWLSLPILAAAAIGAVRLRARALAFVTFAGVHVLFASDVREMLPALPAIAPLVIAALPHLAFLAALYAAASVAYAWPALQERRQHVAPAVAALRAAPPGDVIVAAPDLAPFAFVVRRQVVTPERLEEFTNAQLLVHGRSQTAGALTFGVPAKDVCRKLTGEKFHAVSLVPQRVSARYHAARGVYAIESSPERGEWRWLSREAEIRLPQLGAKEIVLRFHLPIDVPIERNHLSLGLDLERGATAEIIIPATSRLVIRADRTFPSADGRELSVQLLSLEQR